MKLKCRTGTALPNALTTMSKNNTPETDGQSAVPCSDWLAELEAAREHVENAMRLAHGKSMATKIKLVALHYEIKRFLPKPGHSANAKLSDCEETERTL